LENNQSNQSAKNNNDQLNVNNDQYKLKLLSDDIDKLESKNKELVLLMKDQEKIFKTTEDNYKN
jgi:hypothetical protein